MSEETSRHDVVVVGARAAGAATAMLLARAGLDVLVVDRSRYGADTLSTHALMRAGVTQLHRWGLLDAVIRAGTPPVRATTFTYAGAAVRVPVKPRHGVDALYAPRRTVLDPILVDAARTAGAVVEYGATVTGVTRDGTGRVDGVEGRDPTGRPVRHAARWVVGADGLRSAVADAVGAPVERQGTAATAVVYGYWRGLEDDGYQWTFRPEACAGRIPTNDGETCVFVGGTPDRVGRGGLAVLHQLARTASPALAYELRTAPPPSRVRTFGGIPGYLRVPWGPGWALVGDAAYWKDPVSAHGLTDALRDAELLARAIVGAARDEATEADAFDRYHRTRNELSLHLFDIVDAIAGLRWSETEIVDLLQGLGAVIATEAEAVAAFGTEPALIGGPR
jgi:2-polyprenyl-6-methoxyphenol hydroxylase-like FAD-dependent oxidoreductase